MVNPLENIFTWIFDQGISDGFSVGFSDIFRSCWTIKYLKTMIIKYLKTMVHIMLNHHWCFHHDFIWTVQLGRLALLGVPIVLSGVVRAKGPVLPPCCDVMWESQGHKPTIYWGWYILYDTVTTQKNLIWGMVYSWVYHIIHVVHPPEWYSQRMTGLGSNPSQARIEKNCKPSRYQRAEVGRCPLRSVLLQALENCDASSLSHIEPFCEAQTHTAHIYHEKEGAQN